MYAGRHASSPTGTDITAQLKTTLSPACSEVIVDRFNVGAFFEHNTDESDGEIEWGYENESRCTSLLRRRKYRSALKLQ